MEDEYGALMSNRTWELVSRPRGSNVVTGKWVFTHKLRADESFDRYKARWVIRGFTQRLGSPLRRDFQPGCETKHHSHGARYCCLLRLARSTARCEERLPPRHPQRDCFLQLARRFTDPAHPDLICRLHKSLYGLKQTPQAWHSQFATYLLSLGFVEVKTDTSFIFRQDAGMVYLLLYVDDIIPTASSTTLLRRTVSALQRKFVMKDLGPLHFLGITVEHHPDGMFLHQRTYTLDIIKRAAIADCKLCTTPVDL
jgi:hypothetical protein